MVLSLQNHGFFMFLWVSSILGARGFFLHAIRESNIAIEIPPRHESFTVNIDSNWFNRGSIAMGVPKKWMVYFMEHPNRKWMMTGGTPMTQETT